MGEKDKEEICNCPVCMLSRSLGLTTDVVNEYLTFRIEREVIVAIDNAIAHCENFCHKHGATEQQDLIKDTTAFIITRQLLKEAINISRLRGIQLKELLQIFISTWVLEQGEKSIAGMMVEVPPEMMTSLIEKFHTVQETKDQSELVRDKKDLPS